MRLVSPRDHAIIHYVLLSLINVDVVSTVGHKFSVSLIHFFHLRNLTSKFSVVARFSPIIALCLQQGCRLVRRSLPR